MELHRAVSRRLARPEAADAAGQTHLVYDQ
jgi:hypothetical protein